MSTNIYKNALSDLYKTVTFNAYNLSSEKNAITFKVYSFYNKFVDKNFPVYQKLVFEKFGYKINQVKNAKLTHAEFMNKVATSETEVDFLIFFDIDCIPTSPDTIGILLSQLIDKRTLVGAAQTANHIRNGQNLYAGPFFMGVSTKMLKELNYPDFREKEGHYDVAQNVTEIVERNSKYEIKYWWPSDIEVPKWKLHNFERGFGLGTEYENLVYHAFESRNADDPRFIRKCKEVLARK